MSFIDQVEAFLEAYKHIICDEHLEDFMKWYEIIKNKHDLDGEKESMCDSHFMCCLWSGKDCIEGPDTCACFYYSNAVKNIKKMMKLYYRLTGQK